MKTLILNVTAIAVILMAPALYAQQEEAKESQPQATSQPAPEETAPAPNAQNSLPPELRPGHPLNPGDVDVLTGKRDREIEASRRSSIGVVVDPYSNYGYGTYGDFYGMNGRRGLNFNLPLRSFNSSFFFFSRQSSRGFGRGGFR